MKGKGHRYVLLWMGPKLDPVKLSESTGWMDKVTNYENSNLITRSRVRMGHEEESLLSLFPEGFVIFNGQKDSL